MAEQLTSASYIFEADKFWYLEDGKTYKFDANRLGEAHRWCQNQVETEMKLVTTGVLTHNLPIVVSNTNTTEKEFRPYVELAEKYGYMVVSVVVENYHGNKSVHGVPEASMKKMEKRFTIKLR